MKKVLCLAVLATALAGAPAYAKGHGLNVAANLLTGRGGVVGLLNGKGALVVNAGVATASVACSAFCSDAAARWAACSAVAAAAVTDDTTARPRTGAPPLPSALSLAC
jgi:hypothetical protein